MAQLGSSTDRKALQVSSRRLHAGSCDAKPVPGIRAGVLGSQLGVMDCNRLARALPAERDTREGGFRDGLEAMILALRSHGVELAVLNAATEEVLDAYANSN